MSDSDSDFLTNPYQHHENTILKAAGPSVATTIRLGCNRFANSSSHKIQKSKDYQRLYPQARSLCTYRDTSSASTRSVSDWPQRNFQHSLYNNSRRDFNGRCTSPESVRSIGSNVSCITVDTITSALHTSKFNEHDRTKIITTALETSNFNEHDQRKIRNAFRKFMKDGIQKRRAKRINARKFFKGGRVVSGGESGDQASSSSISSDDCRSTRTGVTGLARYKRNTSLFKRPKSRLSDDQSINKIHINSIRKTITDSSNYKDCTKAFYKQSGLPTKYLDSINKFSSKIEQKIHSIDLDNSPNNRNKFKRPAIPPLHRSGILNGISKKQENIASKTHYLLPSQRFNKTTVSNTILEEHENKQTVTDPSSKAKVSEPKSITGTDSSESESVNETQTKEVTKFNNSKRKATNYEEDNKTRKKLKKQTPEKIKKKSPHRDKEKKDFVFAKPGFPVSKYVDLRTEKMIAQSHPQAQSDEPITLKNITSQEPSLGNLHSDKVLNSTTDVSARPSFLKRKLFTQTMDITEIKNISNDNSSDSPTSNIYSDSIKDRREARRLVSGQSCLMREVSKDNNLLDLVQKIVPIDQLQSFSQRSNVERSNIDNTTTEDKYDKVRNTFDVTSILTNCNQDPTSDTYTDEDIFTVNNPKSHDGDKNVEDIKNTDKDKKHQLKQTTPKKSPTKAQPKNTKASITTKQNAQVINNEIKPVDLKPKESAISQNETKIKSSKKVSISQKVATNTRNDTTKRDLSSYSKLFWDSDSEWENPSNNTVYYVGNKQDARVRIDRLEDDILKETLRRDNLTISIEDSKNLKSTPANERTTIEAKKCNKAVPRTVKGPEPKRMHSEISNEKNEPIPTKNNKIKVLSESVRRNNTRKRTPNKKYADALGANSTLKNGTLKTETVLRENTKQKTKTSPVHVPTKTSTTTKDKNPNSGNPITRTKLILRSSIGTSDDSLLNSSRRSERLKRLLPNNSRNSELKNRKDSGKQGNKIVKKQQSTRTKSNSTPIANKTRTVNNSTIKRITPKRKNTPISSQRSCKKQTVKSQNMKSNKDETNVNVSSEKENNERHIQTRSNSMNRSVSENNKINMPLKPVKNNQTSNLTMNSKLRTDNLRRALNNILNDSSPIVTRDITMKNNTIFNPCKGKQSENKTNTKSLDNNPRNTTLKSHHITKQKDKPQFPIGKLSQLDPGPRTRKENKKEENNPNGLKVNNPVNKLSKATVGIIPRHCGLDEVYKSGGFDDTKSMLSFRSTTTVLTRSRRLKMLHIF